MLVTRIARVCSSGLPNLIYLELRNGERCEWRRVAPGAVSEMTGGAHRKIKMLRPGSRWEGTVLSSERPQWGADIFVI